FAGGDAEHLIDPRQLDSRPAGALAAGALVAVYLRPARVGDEIGLVGAQHALDLGGVGRLRDVHRALAIARGPDVGEDRVDGLLGVLLVRADHARRTALDP